MSEIVVGVRLTADGKELVGAASASRAEIGKLADATKQATSEAARLNAEQRNLAQAIVNTQNAGMNQTAAIAKNAEATEVASAQVQRLLDRYDPLGSKLRSLQSDFAALDKAMTSGALAASSDSAIDKTYAALNTEIGKTKGLMQAAGAAGAEGFGAMSGGAIASALSTAQARRELIVLGHEAMTGNISRMPGSFMVLASRIGLTGGALVSVVLPIAAVAGAAIGLAVAIAKGHAEMLEMNNALAMTNGYAGLTRGGMIALAESMVQTGEVTIGSAKGIVTQLVASGRIGAESIGTVARLASNYANATGQDVDKIAPKLIQLFSDPLKGAEELNKSMHFLTVADLDYIETLVRTGQVQEAQLVVAQKMAAQIPDHALQVGYLARSYHNWGIAISEVVNGLGKIGIPDTTQDQMKALQRQIGLESSADPRGQDPASVQLIANYKARLNVLMDTYKAEQQTLAVQTDQAKKLDEQLKVHGMIQQSTTARIKALNQDLALVKGDKASNPVDRAQREVELNKQILDLTRGMGAEGRKNAADAIALSAGQIADATKLYEVQNKSSVDEAEAQLKLGLITKTQHDDWLTWLALADLARKKSDAEATLALGGQTALQKQGLRDQIALYDAMAVARQDKGSNQTAIDAQALLDAQNTAYTTMRTKVDALNTTENKRLDDAIAKQTLFNAEIGKTAAQKELEKAAIERTATSLLQAQADAFRMAADTVVMDQQTYDLYVAQAAALDIQIAKRQQLTGEIAKGAALEASAAATKAQGQAYDKLFNEVERQGKAAFVAVMGHGQDAAKAIGAALKTSVLDLLYELSVKKIVVNIAANVAQSAGIDIAGTSLASAASGGSSLLSMGSAANTASGWMGGPTIGGAFSTSAPAWYTAGVADGTIVAGTTAGVTTGTAAAAGWVSAEGGAAYAGGAAVAGGEAAAAAAGPLAAMGPVGWIALAALAAYAIFSSGSNERQASAQWSGLGGSISRGGGFSGAVTTAFGSSPTDLWAGTQDSSLPGAALSAFNNSITQVFVNADAVAQKLGLDTSGLASVTAHMGATSKGIAADMQAGLNDLADQISVSLLPGIVNLQLNGESLAQTFDRITAAEIAARGAIEAQRRAMDIKLMELQGDAAGALAAKRADELAAMDATLRPLQALINLTEDWATKLATANTAAASAVDAQIQLSQSASQSAHASADAYRALTTTLADAVTKIRGGGGGAAGATLQSTFGTAMTGDTAALAGLPQAATDFLTASLASSRTALGYARDQAKAINMLNAAGAASTGFAAVQDHTALVLDAQLVVLGQIKTELGKPAPDSAVLTLQAKLLGDISSYSNLQLTSLVGSDVTQGGSLQNIAVAGNLTVSLLRQLVDLAGQSAVELAASKAAEVAAAALQVEVTKSTATFAAEAAAVAVLRAARDTAVNNLGVAQTSAYSLENLATGSAGGYAMYNYKVGDDALAGAAQAANVAYMAEVAKAYTLWKAIPGHAAGGIASGWSMVGEGGPELVNFSSPGRVYTARQTQAAMGGAAANDDLLAELKALRTEVAALRRSSDATANNTGRQESFMRRISPDGDSIAVKVV